MRALVCRWWWLVAGMALLFAPAHLPGQDDPGRRLAPTLVS